MTNPSSRSIRVAWAGVLALYLIARCALLDVPLDRDEGAFGAVGQAILRGEVPYRDVFDHKPPGAFYASALGLTLFPPTARGMHLFLALWNLATLLCTAWVAGALWGRRAAVWTGFAFAIASAVPSVQGFTAGTEMLLLLPMALAVRLTIAGTAGSGWRAFAGAGACAALACWFKQSAFLALLVVPWMVVAAHGIRAWKRWGPDLGAVLAGGIALSALVVVPLASSARSGEFWYWSFGHSAIYAAESLEGGSMGEWFAALGERLGDLFSDTGILCIAAVVGIAWRRAAHRWAPCVFLLCSFASVAHSWFLYPHYFAQLTPALAIAAGLGLDRAQEAAGRRRGLLAAAAVLIAIGIPAMLHPWTDPVRMSREVLGAQGFEAGPDLARYLRQHTDPEDRILIWGSEPQILFQAERRSVNPYLMVYPLTGPFPRQREFQETVWEQVHAHAPPYVVVATVETSHQRDDRTDPWLQSRLDGLLRDRYEVAALLVHDERDDLELVEDPDAERVTALGPRVLFEIWRRR